MSLYRTQVFFLVLFSSLSGSTKNEGNPKEVLTYNDIETSEGKDTISIELTEEDYKEIFADDFIEYTAAVLEYKPYDNLSDGGLPLLQKNAQNYLEYAAKAKIQGANIIVFPENGLTSNNIGRTTDILRSQSQLIPNSADEAVPCSYEHVTNDTKIIKELSCGAKELGMYMVVQMAEQEVCSNRSSVTTELVLDSSEDHKDPLFMTGNPEKDCPDSGYLFYNTQVVFDDEGKVVTKYRKKHLYIEGQFAKGDQPDDEALFTTKFGVTFTLQICFDIMYKDPALNNIETYGVQDVIFSTNWIDELPFLTAPQLWKAWSEGNRVNLLASNYFAPLKGSLGSGIFPGFTSKRETYIYDPEGGTTLVIGKVWTTPVGNSSLAVPRFEVTNNSDSLSADLANLGTLEGDKNQQNSSTKAFIETNISTLNTISKSPSQVKIGKDQMFLHEDLERYNHTVLNSSTKGNTMNQVLCHEDNLCCNVEYSYPLNESEEGTFLLLAYSGPIEKGGGIYSMYSQTCAVVYCLSENITSCCRIEDEPARNSTLDIHSLSGTFSTPYIYPSVFTQNLKLYDSDKWEFTVTKTPVHHLGDLTFKKTIENLLSLTLFSRWYDKDPDI